VYKSWKDFMTKNKQILFWAREVSGETIQQAIQRFRERIGTVPDYIIYSMAMDTALTELKQKIQKLPKGHFILGCENS
jgi:hypothetical protein